MVQFHKTLIIENLSNKIVNDIREIIKLSKILKIEINPYVDNYIKLTPMQRNKQRIISVFQEIDALGNYSDHTWFSSLNLHKLFIFIRELADIWNYRAQIPSDTKLNICPPLGDPFRNTDMLIIRQMSYDSLQRFSLSCIENLVKMGVNNEYKSLGKLTYSTYFSF